MFAQRFYEKMGPLCGTVVAHGVHFVRLIGKLTPHSRHLYEHLNRLQSGTLVLGAQICCIRPSRLNFLLQLFAISFAHLVRDMPRRLLIRILSRLNDVPRNFLNVGWKLETTTGTGIQIVLKYRWVAPEVDVWGRIGG